MFNLNITKEKRNYYILIISVMSMWITVSTVYMVLPLYFQSYGVSKSQNGILIAIGTFAGVISSMLAGRYADTHGRKPVLLFGAGLYSTAFFLFAYLGRDFWSFFFLRFLAGFGFYMVPVAITTIAADIFPRVERGKAMGFYSMSAGVGQLVGPLFAGRFIEASSFFSYFILSGILIAISWIVIFLFVDETLEKSIQTINKNNQNGTIGFLNKVRGLGLPVAIFFVAILIYRTGVTMVDPLLSLYLNESLGIDLTQMGYFFAIRALITLVVAPVAGDLSDRYGRKPVFLGGIFLLIGSLMGYFYAFTFTHVLIVRIIQSMSNAILQPTQRAYISDLLTEENRGFGIGFFTTLLSQGSTMGSIFGGWIADIFFFGAIFLVGSASVLIGGLVVLFKVPEPPKN